MQTISDIFNIFVTHQSSWLWNISGIILGMALLYFGGDWLVDSASAIAKKLHIRPMIIGLTIVAFGTSCPELLVSTISALEGQAGVAIGNVVGSNFTNIALVFGLATLLTPIAIESRTLDFGLNPRKWGPYAITMICSLLVLLFSLIGGDHIINHIEGLVLVVCLGLFMAQQIANGHKDHQLAQDDAAKETVDSDEDDEPVMSTPKAIIMLIVGLLVLVVGAKSLVDGGVGCARLLEIPELIIGLTIVALGTSLPELAASVIGIIKGEDDIALGNILGSNIFNVLAVLGVSSTIKPIAVDNHAIVFDMVIMLGITLLLGILMACSKYLHKGEFIMGRISGALLLGSYIVYTVVLYLYPQIDGSQIMPLILGGLCILFLIIVGIWKPAQK